jgi:hypothetical protein
MKRKKKTSKKAKRTQRNRILHGIKKSLIRSTTPAIYLSEIRENLTDSIAKELFTWISKSETLYGKIFGDKYPTTYKDWGKTLVFGSTSKKNEFFWAFLILQGHSINISKFVELSYSYQNYFLQEEYDICNRILDQIEEKFGYSLWAIEKRITLLQYSKGLDAQKKYTEQIKQAEYIFDRLPFLAHYISHRSEPSVSPDRFKLLFNEQLEKYNISNDFIGYVKFLILNEHSSNPKDLNEILRFELNTSIIDCYETFIQLAQYMQEIGTQKEIDNIKYYIRQLSKSISDNRLFALNAINNKQNIHELSPTSSDINNFELFLNNQQSQLFEKALEIITKYPTDIGALYAAALSSSKSNIEVIRKRKNRVPPFLIPFLEIFSNDVLEDQWIELYQYSLALRGTVLSTFLQSIISKEYSSHPLGKESDFCIDTFIYVKKLNPIFLFWFDTDKDRERYRNLLIESIGNSSSKDIIQKANEDKISVYSKKADLWNSIKDLIAAEDYSKALSNSFNLEGSSINYYRRYASKTKIYCYFKMGDYANCIEEIVHLFVNLDFNINLLPIKNVYDTLSEEVQKDISKSIDFSIFTYLYTYYFAYNKQYLLSNASEDFIFSCGVKKPSELRLHVSSFKKSILIFYLKHVCVESTMDTWLEFSSSKEVSLERVEICKLIIDLEPSQKDAIQSEIREIMQRLKLKERLREIDQSKIYIDTESIKKAAQTNLKENYARYTSFLESGMTQEDKKVREMANQAFASVNIDRLLSLSFPRHEMYSLFESMLLSLRDEFVSSNQHGLDGYLSVRIRHNTLSGQLWSPFESEHFTIYKDLTTSEYKPNDYWIDQLDIKDSPVDCTILEEALVQFKEQYENLVNVLRNNWIQIRKVNDQVGLFDFRLIEQEVGALSSFVSKDTSLDQFIDDFVSYFITGKLEPSLKLIRSKIQQEIKPQVQQMLTDLQAACEQIDSDTSRFRAAVLRARTNVQITLDRITEWFRVSSIEKMQPFSVEEAISISDASIKTVCSVFDYKYYPSKKMEQFVIKGKLTSFVDILFIAFDNIVQHSNYPEKPIAEIFSDFTENIIIIKITNPVHHHKSEIYNKRQHIAEKQKEVLDQPFSSSVTQEGGTGFFKMHKILLHDFSLRNQTINPELDFGYLDDETFFVEVCIPVKNIVSLEDA